MKMISFLKRTWKHLLILTMYSWRFFLIKLWGRLEKCNITWDHKHIQSGTISSISFLTSRISQKDTFESFRIQLKRLVLWSWTKHTQSKILRGKNDMLGKKNTIWYLSIKNCRKHTVNQIANYKSCIPPEVFENIHINWQSLSHLKQVTILCSATQFCCGV